MTRISVRHSVELPDPVRVERYRRVPELGPRVLFFTGGSAMRKVSRALKAYTHNSIHLTTSFDSGGSSAKMRTAFDILSVGDLRNRLMSLADETVRGNPEIYRLFSHRLPADAEQRDLAHVVERMASGDHELISAIPRPLQHIIKSHAQCFYEHMPATFDLRGASIGNIVLVGGYLQTGRDIDAVIFLFSMLVKVLGTVRPITAASLHLEAELADGTTVIGQHELTGTEVPPIESPILRMRLVDSLEHPKPAELNVSAHVVEYIRQAELIVYPMGSFWTSIVANLLPSGVGRAIAASDVPKIYIPNCDTDPEQLGMKIHDCVRVLRETLSRDIGADLPMDRVVNFVLLDTAQAGANYDDRLDREALRALGVELIEMPLSTDRSAPYLAAEPVVQALLSLA